MGTNCILLVAQVVVFSVGCMGNIHQLTQFAIFAVCTLSILDEVDVLSAPLLVCAALWLPCAALWLPFCSPPPPLLPPHIVDWNANLPAGLSGTIASAWGLKLFTWSTAGMEHMSSTTHACFPSENKGAYQHIF